MIYSTAEVNGSFMDTTDLPSGELLELLRDLDSIPHKAGEQRWLRLLGD